MNIQYILELAKQHQLAVWMCAVAGWCFTLRPNVTRKIDTTDDKRKYAAWVLIDALMTMMNGGALVVLLVQVVQP